MSAEFFKFLERRIAENIRVSMLAKIVRFDAQSMRADIQPLQQGLPMITEVPVALQKAGPFFIRVPYEPGDVVVVVFSDFSLDGSSEARHRLDDAIIVGGITMGQLPSEHTSDLVIARGDMSLKLTISDSDISISTEDKDINLVSNSGNINISSVEGSVNISSTDSNVNISGKNSSGSW